MLSFVNLLSNKNTTFSLTQVHNSSRIFFSNYYSIIQTRRLLRNSSRSSRFFYPFTWMSFERTTTSVGFRGASRCPAQAFIIWASDWTEWVPIFCTDANRRTLFGASSAERKDVRLCAWYFENLQEIAIHKSDKGIFFFPFYLCVSRSVYLTANFPVSLSLPALFLADLYIFPSSLTQMGYGWKLMRVTNEEDIFVRNNAP